MASKGRRNSRVKTLQTFAVKLKIWDEKNCWNEKDGRRDMEFGGGAWGHTRQCVLGFTHILPFNFSLYHNGVV